MTASMTDKLIPLIVKSGSALEPTRFYHEVQVAFHDIESECYDDLHGELYVYLVDIFRRLFLIATNGKSRLRLLDIGAGTGLVETFLAGEYSTLIERIDVVEPNGRMISRLEEKNRNWKLPIVCRNAYLESAGLEGEYDVAICSSVLHHVPDLAGFFSVLRSLVKPEGYILTMQDPRTEALQDTVAAERRSVYQRHEAAKQPPQAVVKRLVRALLAAAGAGDVLFRRDPLEKKVNRLLKERSIIRRSLSLEEIWAVTDIHVPGQPGGIGLGISLEQLRGWLPGYDPESYLTYNFFNANYLGLPEEFKEIEKRYLLADDPHGFLFASLFRRTS